MVNMQSVWRIAGLSLVVVAAGGFEARAQAPPAPPVPKVRMTLFYSPATTVLKAPALAGKPKYENDGDYFGLMAEAHYGKVSLNGSYQGGTSEDIEGGADFTAATFNPLTYEKSNQIDISLGYTVLDNPYVGTLDATVGYYRLWAGPKISPANWYKGVEVGLRGRRELASKFALVYKVGYVPDYSVHGYMEGNLEAGPDGDIQLYRFGLEYPIDDHVLLTGGYQRVRLEGRAVSDASTAIVTLTGFYYGLVFTF